MHVKKIFQCERNEGKNYKKNACEDDINMQCRMIITHEKNNNYESNSY